MVWVMPVITGLINAMEIVTFIQFIEEEAIQSAALGTFLALRHNSIRGAVLGITRTRTILMHLETINESIGWVAIYSKGCFADFVTATKTNLEIYDDLILTMAKAKAASSQ